VLLPLGVMLLCVLGLLAASGHAPAVNGHIEPWYQRLDIPALHHRSDVVQFMLGAGVLLFLQNSANIIVRLVLTGAGSRPEASEPTLKGGRLLGAMERTFIFALGVGGSLTAAAIIVAAKGLLRFPEISRTGSDGTRPGVDTLTEYFLVGSLASWLLALAFVPLFGGY
jgi:hypothetical protein